MAKEGFSDKKETSFSGWCWGLQYRSPATRSCDSWSLLGRIMRLGKANFAGLASPRQQSEMKCILAGMWPPLKPLPVFKYETAAYRATIDFDKLRGEWVCRKTSFPSNTVQELRGGLREITMALPHGEVELSLESAEQPEQEQEQDTHRRLETIRDWRENSESGKHYFELRRYLSESQREEIDDSLRLSLTARQLQFNSKNLGYVFDALSTAGGRFATLIAFAERNEVKSESILEEKRGAAPEAEREIDKDKPSLGASVGELSSVHTHEIPFVQDQDQEAEELCADAGEVPAVSIKSVLLEQEPPSLAEWTARTTPRPIESETSETWDANSASFVQQLDQEGRALALEDVAEDVRMDESSGERSHDTTSRLHAFEISVFQVMVAFLFLFALIVVTVGLTMGFGPLGGGLREASKSILAFVTNSPTRSDQKYESTSRISTPPAASSNELPGAKVDDTAPSEDKSKENPGGSMVLEKVPSMDPRSSRTVESKPHAEPEVHSERRSAGGPNVRNVPPPVFYNEAPSRDAAGATSSTPGSPAPSKSAGTMGVAPHLARPSVVLVNIPVRGSHAFRVSFPEKAIAATSSFAMMSQLSVLVSPGPWPHAVHRPARLEAGELVSFIWPRFPGTRNRYGMAELIKVRVTVGQFGQVRAVDFLSGSPSFLPATTRAIRQWHYTPTLLDKKPVQAQEEVTIEFHPGRILGAGVDPASSAQLAAVE